MFPKQRLAFADFWDDEFSSQFLFAVRIVTLDLRYYLLVDLHLSSPVFGTCSVELTKNVVRDVVNRLITFASLGLSAWERTFLIAEDPILTPCDKSFLSDHDDVFQPFAPGLDIPIDLAVTFLPPRVLLSWLFRIRLPLAIANKSRSILLLIVRIFHHTFSMAYSSLYHFLAALPMRTHRHQPSSTPFYPMFIFFSAQTSVKLVLKLKI